MMNSQSPRLSPCVVAEFSDAGNLANALNALEQSHFEPQNVSIITHAHDSGFAGLGDSAATDVEKASDDKSMVSEKTMGASTLAGGAIGAALGTATLIGPLLVVGPIVGMAAGAVAGGLLSAVEGWNIDRQTADSYQTKVESGSSLIIVSDDPPRLTEASQILATCKPATLQRFE